jgi:hypothetical protein
MTVREPYDENVDYELIRDVALDVVKYVDERRNLGVMLGMVKEMEKAIRRIDRHLRDKKE